MQIARRAAVFFITLPCAGLWAQDATDPVDLAPIVVAASRLPQPVSAVAAQVSVIDSEAIRRSLTEDFDGLLRYAPGVELQTAGTRFRGGGVNIRGIEGNRVRIEIDGVPLRDGFVIGAYSNGGRLLVEPDRIERVEILHGPASVMYGSDALGGVMAISTWNPAGFARGADTPWTFSLRAGLQTSDDSRFGSGLAAWNADAHGMLAAATYRSGHELDHGASTDTPTDTQDWDSSDYMLRYTWDTPGGDRLRLTANRWERDTTTEIRSLLGYGRRFRWTTSMQGDDRDESRRLAADYEFSARGNVQGTLLVYDTLGETDQWTFERRAIAPVPVAIDRRFRYTHDQWGARGFVFRETAWGRSRHRLGLGAEWNAGEIDELRDGLQTNLADGSMSNVILGEEMPVRDFPISRTEEVAIWLQDDISFMDGRGQLTPAVRWDRYDLDPRPDDLWREDNPETGVVSISEDQVTPRLGALFRVDEKWSLYAQYSEGFRAPPFEDANIGFDIPLFGFRAIPNPDLRSETSEGLELGLRRIAAFSNISLTVFHTDYEDFIESRVLIGRDPDSGDLIFQSRNVARARIRGVDLRYEQDLSAWNRRLDGWRLTLAGYWAEGDNRRSGEPLNSIAPPQAVAGFAWTSTSGAWDFSATGTFTAAKDESDIDTGDGPRFATPSWATLDLATGWRPREGMELRAGVFNLTDETYWRWLDVANLESDDPMIPLLSRPGRSFSFSAQISF